jgi:sugar fermentation stimulation protein A
MEIHPEFGEALADAKKAGVKVIFLRCHVEPASLTVADASIQ